MIRFAHCIIVLNSSFHVLVFTSSKYKKLIYLLILSVNGTKLKLLKYVLKQQFSIITSSLPNEF